MEEDTCSLNAKGWNFVWSIIDNEEMADPGKTGRKSIVVRVEWNLRTKQSLFHIWVVKVKNN